MIHHDPSRYEKTTSKDCFFLLSKHDLLPPPPMTTVIQRAPTALLEHRPSSLAASQGSTPLKGRPRARCAQLDGTAQTWSLGPRRRRVTVHAGLGTFAHQHPLSTTHPYAPLDSTPCKTLGRARSAPLAGGCAPSCDSFGIATCTRL